MAKVVTIAFNGIQSWEDETGNVNSILEKYTGTSEYPSTKSFPPIILVPELDKDGVEELRNLDGVQVNYADPEDED